MDKLKDLMARCACGVYVSVNEHRDSYESAAQAIEQAESAESPPQITPEVRQQMIMTDTVIHLQFYPHTPVGSYSIWHYDLDAALDIALDTFK